MAQGGRKVQAGLPRGFLRSPVHLIALGFGAGCAPRAPGTFGTLVGVALYLGLAGAPVTVYLVVVLALALVGVAVCHRTATDLGVHDHPAIVWDEVVGYLVAMIAAPSGAAWILLGFLLFRVLDILKPWPISWADRRVTGGWGIMLDDLIAGLLANACLHLIAYLL